VSADVTHAPAAPTGARPGAIALPRVPFCVIRHGETDFNRDGRVAGRSDAMLTVAGRCAASRLATLDWPGAIRLYCSPQTRARDTAALAFPDLTPVVLSDLRERDWGDLEGAPVSQLGPRDATPPGGEPWPEMCARVARALQQVLAGHDPAHPDPALPVLVAHSGIIRATRLLTGGTAGGPSPANAVPHLFLPAGTGWRETDLTGAAAWTA